MTWPPAPLRPRQVNLLLAVLFVAAAGTGVTSWLVEDRWSGWFVTAHAVSGLALLLLAPAKVRGPVAAGFRRRRHARWVSAAFGVLVVGVVALGVLHATGIWYGVGMWSALWTHTILIFLLLPLFVWHLATRPVTPRLADLDRRAFITGGLALGGGALVYVVQEGVTRLAVLPGAERRFTGSHEVASHDPAGMPAVIWLDDQRPAETGAATWSLVISGRQTSVASLRGRSRPVLATLDCTGGWWSEQSWDAVPLSELVTTREGRSLRVRSQTGYDRLFSYDDLESLYLAIGYNGEPLRSGHGAPVRLIAPGRRGYWWVKWVTSIEADGRPAWFQPPLPLT